MYSISVDQQPRFEDDPTQYDQPQIDQEPFSPREKMGQDESRKLHDRVDFVHPHKTYMPFSDTLQNLLVIENVDTEAQEIVIKELKDFLAYVSREVTNMRAKQDLFLLITALVTEKQQQLKEMRHIRPTGTQNLTFNHKTWADYEAYFEANKENEERSGPPTKAEV